MIYSVDRDITPVSSPPVEGQMRDTARTYASPLKRPSEQPTPFSALPDPNQRIRQGYLQRTGEIILMTPDPVIDTSDAGPQIEPTIERIASDRVRLLARQYVNQQASREDVARSEMLTQRLSMMVPRVTTEMLDTLDADVPRRQERAAYLADLKALYGLE